MEIKKEKTLNPCPFCGSNDVIIRAPFFVGNDDWTIMCPGCGLDLMFFDGKKDRTIALWNAALRKVKK